MRTTEEAGPAPETVAREFATLYLDVSADFLEQAYTHLEQLERPVSTHRYSHRLASAQDRVERGRDSIDDYRWEDGVTPIDGAYTDVNEAVDDVEHILDGDDDALPHVATALLGVRRLLVDSAEHLEEARRYREQLA